MGDDVQVFFVLAATADADTITAAAANKTLFNAIQNLFFFFLPQKFPSASSSLAMTWIFVTITGKTHAPVLSSIAAEP